MKYQYIELFAGCGGMSLGLHSSGFDLYMANELSPMAGETFAYNILKEDLSELAEGKKKPKNVLWINSNYDIKHLKERLRENPFEYSKGSFSDLDSEPNYQGKLLIGNIDHFLSRLSRNRSLIKKFQGQNIDILSGGPPCQGFSLAGKRIRNDFKNQLPLSFARFAGLIKPKIVLLENVKGITSPFTEDGIKHFAWLEVSKAFSLQGYIPICLMVNSKYFGIPQNRPRFILIGFRKDIFLDLKGSMASEHDLTPILENSFNFYKKANANRNNLDDIGVEDLSLYDIENCKSLFDGRLFPKITTNVGNFITSKEAISDISNALVATLSNVTVGYPKRLNDTFKNPNSPENGNLYNHLIRNHNYLVKARFRLYQVLNEMNGFKKEALQIISAPRKDTKDLDLLFREFAKFDLLIKTNEGEILGKIKSLDQFRAYIKLFNTKKHSQRALKENEPAPAQLTIPDDLCHYDKNQLRTMTVREMARFQSFPDWFVFKSKITTGGKQRCFEVPQYTQVGNAVPPLLAYELGVVLKKILNTVNNAKKKD